MTIFHGVSENNKSRPLDPYVILRLGLVICNVLLAQLDMARQRMICMRTINYLEEDNKVFSKDMVILPFFAPLCGEGIMTVAGTRFRPVLKRHTYRT
jgi:hypothetical protein